MKFYLEIFFIFFKIGMFTIGGGYAMVPLIKKVVVDEKNWISQEEFLDGLAISQSAPGVLAVNISVYVGNKLGKTKGIIFASLGAILPSFLIILFIAIFFMGIQDSKYFIAGFKGIKPVVISLIFYPALSMAKNAGVTYKNCWIPIGVAGLIAFVGVSPIFFIILSMIVGNLYYAKVADKK